MRLITSFLAMAVVMSFVFLVCERAHSQTLERGIRQIGADSHNQALGNYGAGVNVGIFDTPIDESHPDLNVTGSIDLHSLADFVNSEHGTHVAGTVAGTYTGVATQANIVDVSVLSPFGSWASGVTLRNAMSAARAAGVSIANMSFGYSGGYTLDRDEYLAIRESRDQILVVKAAGNDGVQLGSVKSQYGAKKALDNFMIVGSVDSNNQLSSFSNRPGGGCFARRVKVRTSGRTRRRWRCRRADQYRHFFIVAPGENVRSTVPGGGTGYLSGTSMATPHVAGAAALLQGRWGHLKNNPQATANILFKTATDLGKKGVDSVYGWGLLNVDRAFQPYGETFLNTTKKKYRGKQSGLRRTGRLSRMIGWNTRINSFSVFDEFDRDFSVSADSVSLAPEPELGRRMIDMVAGFGDPAFETVNAGRTFNFGETVTVSYNVTSARETDVHEGRAVAGPGLETYLAETETAEPTGTWQFEMHDTNGAWSLFSGGDATQSKPFAFTSMGGYELASLSNGENIENPVLGMVDSGDYVGSTVSVIEGVQFMFGRTEGASNDFMTTEYDSAATTAGLRLSPTENFSFGVAATQLSEDNGLFTSVGSGALSLGEQFTTEALTVSTEYRPAKNWVVSAAYSMAKTTQSGGTDLLTLNGTMLSDSSAVAVARTNLLNVGDRLAFTASLPLATISGSATSRLASHLNENGNMVYREIEHDLKETERPVELSLGYTTPMGIGMLHLGAAAELNERTTGEGDFGGFAAYSLNF